MKRGRSLASAVLAFTLGVASPVTAAPKDDAAPSLRAGLQAYKEARYEDAIEQFEAAYAIDPNPAYLYAWAQAERESGDCQSAVRLYERFLEGAVEPAAAEAARKNIERCDSQRPTPPPPVLVDPPATTSAPPLETAPEPQHDDVRADRRVRSPAGLGLTIAGGVVMLGGGGTLATSGVLRRRQSNIDDYQRFNDLDLTIDRLNVAGSIALGVGTALLLAGIITWARAPRRRGVGRMTDTARLNSR